MLQKQLRKVSILCFKTYVNDVVDCIAKQGYGMFERRNSNTIANVWYLAHVMQARRILQQKVCGIKSTYHEEH